jgi:hypothetical protein
MREMSSVFIHMICVISATLLSFNVRATVITFDDLVYNPEDTSFYSNPLSDQYLSKGLLIGNGYLVQYSSVDPVVSSPNYLLGGDYLTLTFVGDLPTMVSMYISAWRQEVIYVNATDATGKVTAKKTTGWAGELDNTPYVPGQLISFNESNGISKINLYGYYGMRTSAEVDNLTYSYSSVPEPASIGLFVIGLCGFALLRRKISL